MEVGLRRTDIGNRRHPAHCRHRPFRPLTRLSAIDASTDSTDDTFAHARTEKVWVRSRMRGKGQDSIRCPSSLSLVPSLEVACHSRHQRLLLILRGHLDAAKELGGLPGPQRGRMYLTPVDEDISVLGYPETKG